MKAAVFHEGAATLSIEEVAAPQLRPGAAIVAVEAAFVTGLLARRLAAPNGGAILPERPFVPGMDTVGRVLEVADDVAGLAPGDPVYGNHWHGSRARDDHGFIGSFGMGAASARLLRRWRHGNLAERLMLPAACFTPLGAAAGRASPAVLARLGWLGTAYGGLLRAGLAPGETVIVNGASGMVGASAVLVALAMGAARIVATGRRRDLLKAVAAIAPDRIAAVALAGDGRDTDRIATAASDAGGAGGHVLLDAVGHGAGPAATQAALAALGRGGRAVLVGAPHGMALAFDYDRLMFREIAVMGSLWFPRRAAAVLVAMVAAGTLDLAPIEAIVFPLDRAMAAARRAADGGLGLRHVAVTPCGGASS